MRLQPALEGVGVLLQQIANITGTPGLSVGVLHHGEVIHTASYGFRDIEQKAVPNEDTSWLICSLTKAFTASIVGMLIDEGKIDFGTQLHEILPEYRRADAQANITIEDLLSHRTGLAPYDGLWLSSDNHIPMPRSQAIPILQHAPAVFPLRTHFLYNNIAFEVLGQVVEKVTGLTYSQVLHDRIILPLGLNRTFYAGQPLDDNTAKSYAVLANRSFYEIPPWGYGNDLLIGAAGAIRSSVSDLLLVYKEVMREANHDVGNDAKMRARSPFRLQKDLFVGKSAIGSKTLREYSYASGWIRAQLPNYVDLFADFNVPMLLEQGTNSRLMMGHQGYIAGNVAYVALFPETMTAVVVLANSAGLCDAMRLLGQAVVETVFGNEVDGAQYREIAQEAGERNINRVSEIHEDLLHGKTVPSPIRDLSAYTGRYYNSMGNYFIEIRHVDGKLQVSYNAHEFDTFDLETYQTDSFFWWLDYDESMKRARLPYPKQYFILRFGCPSKPAWWNFGATVVMECLTWKHEFSIPGDGEVFRKAGHCDHSREIKESDRVNTELK